MEYSVYGTIALHEYGVLCRLNLNRLLDQSIMFSVFVRPVENVFIFIMTEMGLNRVGEWI